MLEKLPDELVRRYYSAVSWLRRPGLLPPEPLGAIVIGHARFPIRQPITMADGQLWFSGTAFAPFRKRLDPSVTEYQIVDPDGEVVHRGPIHPDMYGVITTSAMSLTYTARIELRRGGPTDGPRTAA